MDAVEAVAREWLLIAEELGWGMEGPPGADEVAQAVRAAAEGRQPQGVASVVDEDRHMGLRPVDALFEAARLVVESSLTSGVARTDELVSAARGWLRIASGR